MSDERARDAGTSLGDALQGADELFARLVAEYAGDGAADPGDKRGRRVREARQAGGAFAQAQGEDGVRAFDSLSAAAAAAARAAPNGSGRRRRRWTPGPASRAAGAPRSFAGTSGSATSWA
ncbi:hypothetical protein ACFWGF_28015, partial [Streptomyces sp. NPDC060243]